MFPDRSKRAKAKSEWAEQMPRFRALAPAAQERIDRIKAEVTARVSIRDEVRAVVVEPIVKAEQDAALPLVEDSEARSRVVCCQSGLEIVLPAGRSADLLADDRVTRVFIANDGEPELSVTLRRSVSRLALGRFRGRRMMPQRFDTASRPITPLRPAAHVSARLGRRRDRLERPRHLRHRHHDLSRRDPQGHRPRDLSLPGRACRRQQHAAARALDDRSGARKGRGDQHLLQPRLND